GEIIGQDWKEVDENFFSYAAKDAVATLPTYLAILARAERLAAEFGPAGVLPGGPGGVGVPTQAVPGKKAVAPAQVQPNGMCVDQALIRQTGEGLRRRLDEAVARVREVCPGLYNNAKNGSLVLTKTGAPSRSIKALAEQLDKVAGEVEAELGARPSVP